MLVQVRAIFNDLIDFLYPRQCSACGRAMNRQEFTLCISCKAILPKTPFFTERGNHVEKLFWGRVAIEKAASYYFFTKGEDVQQLLHNIKYENQKEAAYEVGECCGLTMKETGFRHNIDLIIPVPLHPKKERKRGFNQSEWFGKGLSSKLKIKQSTGNLIRLKNTDSQTQKSRIERWENVKDVFSVKDPQELEGKHVLLIDDVVTTGSTLEACAKAMKEVAEVKISIVTIAVA